LAGGTALALQVGHRISVDLDWFIPKLGEPEALFLKLKSLRISGPLPKTQIPQNEF